MTPHPFRTPANERNRGSRPGTRRERRASPRPSSALSDSPCWFMPGRAAPSRAEPRNVYQPEHVPMNSACATIVTAAADWSVPERSRAEPTEPSGANGAEQTRVSREAGMMRQTCRRGTFQPRRLVMASGWEGRENRLLSQLLASEHRGVTSFGASLRRFAEF